MIRRASAQRGISIAVALLVLVVVSVIALAIAGVGTQNLSLANADRLSEQSRYAAEAGIADAENSLINDNNASGALFTKKATPSDTSLTYTVTVTNNNRGTSSTTAPDGTSVPRGMVYIRSEGQVNGNTYARVGCLAVIEGGPVFPYAAFGVSGLTLGGTSAFDDSWNSANGTYTATAVNGGSDVGTNGTTSGAISYSGGAKNYGNVYVGPGGGSGSVNGTSPTNFTGSVVPLNEPLYLPPPQPNMVPSYTDLNISQSHSTTTVTPGAYHNFTTASQCTINLSAGTYYFSGNVLFGSQNTVNLPTTGTVKIYVDGTWDSGGGAFNNPQGIPAAFQIYGTASCTSLTINGGNGAYYVVDAPNANVTVQGNSAVYGAVIGNTVQVQGGAQIHYDTALKTLGPPTPKVLVRTWMRL